MKIIKLELDKNLNQKQIIELIVDLFVKNKMTTAKYLEAINKRQEQASFYIGNYISIPHGVSEYSKEIKKTGLVLIRSIKGVEWDGEKVHYIIGIASNDDSHMDILSNIAINFDSEKKVKDSLKIPLDKIVEDINKW